jgi:hypothetical protein
MGRHAGTASHNIQLMVDTASYVAMHQSGRAEALAGQSKTGDAERTLWGYEAIGIAAAEQAVAAAWNVISGALTAVLTKL